MMRRVDRIRSMSVTELAEALMENGMDNCIDFCQNKWVCEKRMESEEEIPVEECKLCLIKWLMQEAG